LKTVLNVNNTIYYAALLVVFKFDKSNMLQKIKLSLAIMVTLFLVGCEQSSQNQLTEEEAALTLPDSAFDRLDWKDLIPPKELEALLNPPSYYNELEDGSLEDQISNKLKSTVDPDTDDPYQQALVSTNIVKEMNGRAVQIPGYVVPLEFDDDQTITQFFLVPFFGACFHLPPPPPNQIVYVNYPEGLKLDSLYDPFFISGILNTSLIENDVATAAYTMQMQSYEKYYEQ